MKKQVLLFWLLWLSPALLFSQEFPIATDNYSQTEPIVNFDGEQFFISYVDRGGGTSYGFYGKFISTEGEVSASAHQLVAPHNALSFMHNKAVGDDQFLMVWSRQRGPYDYQRDAYGRLIQADGTPDGGIFRISTHNTISASFIRVAFDGENYLVIWQEGFPHQSAEIKGQFVSSQGAMVGNNFVIRPEGVGDQAGQVYPDLLFDGTNYLVVWDDDRTGNRRIYGLFLDTEGQPVGDDFPISESISADQQLVQVAHNGTNYLAAWGDKRDGSKAGIYGQIFNSDGSLTGENIAISPLAHNEERSWPRVGSNGSQYLVVWDHQTFESKSQELPLEVQMKNQAAGVNRKNIIWYEVHGRLIHQDGSFASDQMIIGANDYHQRDPTVCGHADVFITAWQDSRVQNQYSDIYGLMTEAVEPPALHPPQNLEAVFEDEVVTLTWEEPEADRDLLYYNVYRDQYLLASEISETLFADTDIVQDTIYSYYVTAVYSHGESEPSNEAEVSIPVLYVDITFWVTEAYNGDETKTPEPLEGVKVILETAGEAYTDAQGYAIFENVSVAESLDYSAEKEGFFPYAGSIENVHHDLEVHLMLESDDTFVPRTAVAETKIWPVPARGQVNIHASQQMESVVIMDLTGRTLHIIDDIQSKHTTLTVSDLPGGIYLLKIISGPTHSSVHKMVIK